MCLFLLAENSITFQWVGFNLVHSNDCSLKTSRVKQIHSLVRRILCICCKVWGKHVWLNCSHHSRLLLFQKKEQKQMGYPVSLLPQFPLWCQTYIMIRTLQKKEPMGQQLSLVTVVKSFECMCCCTVVTNILSFLTIVRQISLMMFCLINSQASQFFFSFLSHVDIFTQ